MLDQRSRRWAAIWHPFGRRNWSVIFDASIGNKRCADAGFMLSQRCRQCVGIETALASFTDGNAASRITVPSLLDDELKRVDCVIIYKVFEGILFKIMYERILFDLFIFIYL